MEALDEIKLLFECNVGHYLTSALLTGPHKLLIHK